MSKLLDGRYKVSTDTSIVLNEYGTIANVYDRKSRKLCFFNKDTYNLVSLLNNGLTLNQLAQSISDISQRENFVNKSVKTTADLKRRGILVSEDNEAKGLLRQEKTSPALTSIQFEVTRRCNLRCTHCYLNDYSGENELTRDEIYSLIDKASDIGVHEIHITGGEPLVRKDLKDILSRIYEKGMYGKLYTNGMLITDKFITFLKDLGIEAVKISLDGFKPKTHNDIRKAKNGFERTIRNIRKLSEAGIPVEVGSVINKLNVSETRDLIDFFKNDLKVKYHIDSFVPIGQGLKSVDKIVLSDEEYVEALKNEFSDAVERGSTEIRSEKQEFFCGAGNSYVFINANGLVKFCPTMSDDFSGGNLKDESIENIWLNSPFFKRTRNVNCKFYSDCPHAASCLGGCRSRSLLKHGKIDEPDLQMCKMFLATTGIKSPALLALENQEKNVQLQQ